MVWRVLYVCTSMVQRMAANLTMFTEISYVRTLDLTPTPALGVVL